MISQKLKETVESPSSGVIRKMFEEGAALKAKFGAENVYDFSIGNPDLDPPQKVLALYLIGKSIGSISFIASSAAAFIPSGSLILLFLEGWVKPIM